MKSVRNVIKTLVWSIIIIYLIIITMVHLPSVQAMLGSQTGEALSEKLGTKVTVDKVNLGFLNRIIIDGLTIYDRKSKRMITASRMAAKIDYARLIREGRVYISSAQLFGFNGKFYKEDEKTVANYQFVLDSLASKDDDNKRSIELSVNSLVIRHGAIRYDRLDKPRASAGFDPWHVSIRDISAHLTMPYYTGDSLAVNMKKLSMKEQSGFDLRELSFRLTANKAKAEMNDLRLRLPGTGIKARRLYATYADKGGKQGLKALAYDGAIEMSRIEAADLACFVPALKDTKLAVFIAARFHGDSENLFIDRLGISSQDKAISLDASGSVRHTGAGSAWTAAIRHSHCDMAALGNIVKSLGNGKGSLPAYVLNMGHAGFKGRAWGFKGRGANGSTRLHADGQVETGIGNMLVKLDKDGRQASANVETGQLEMGKLLADKRFGALAAKASARWQTAGGKMTGMEIDGKLPFFTFNNHRYRDMSVNGTYGGGTLGGTLRLDDPDGRITVDATVNTAQAAMTASVKASARDLDLATLGITDKWKGSRLSFDLTAQGTEPAKGVGIPHGDISISNLSLLSENNSYRLDGMTITSEKDRIYMRSDFGEAAIEGRYKPGTLAQSVACILGKKLPTLCGDSKKAGNAFRLSADIRKTDWLEAFFGISVELDEPLAIRAEVDDGPGLLGLTCRTGGFTYSGATYRDALITAVTEGDSLSLDAQAKKMSADGHGLELGVRATAAGDKLKAGVNWDDHRRKPLRGALNAETDFKRNADGQPDFHISVMPSEILVNDTVWTVKPSDITVSRGDLMIDHFAIEHNRQHLRIDGMATKSEADSITVDMRDLDVKYILDLVNFHSVEFEGHATGKAHIKSVFQTPAFSAALTVGDFRFEGGRMGKLTADVNWNKTEKQIDIDARAADNNGGLTLIRGNVSPPRNSIDLAITAGNTNIEFLEGLCGSFMGDVKAKANGEVRLQGQLDNINLTGLLTADGNVRIKPLNTTYTLENDTIRFHPDIIVFSRDTIRDRNGNIGIVNGALHHKHLTHLTYDIGISARHLLCYDTHAHGSGTFYGTVSGNGECSIKGGNGRVDIDIEITPEKGSFIEYNAASPETVSDMEFITWHDKTPREHTEKASANPATGEKTATESTEDDDMPSDMRLNLLVNMTPDATLRVLMDKANEDYIALNGTGSIRASYFNKGAFDMFGTYMVDHGEYKLTIQNIMKKVFKFQNGGTIVFGGDPYDAALNLKALYTINGVPLSDLQIGKSFSGNNVRVDCLMNISGTPLAPRVDFDIDLPTVNDDAEQMVRTVINSEEEMNQQVVYLLGVGRFYVQQNNNGAEDEERQGQTSLAMQSLLSGTISQQINSLLGNIVKNNNWTFGANISTGDEGFNNAEYEGLLSGRLLDNRLVINGQFGYRDNANATTSFIGDFDINYLLLPSGNIALKVYNQTNDRYFTKSSLNTQGIALIMKKDFSSLMELFGFKRKTKHTGTDSGRKTAVDRVDTPLKP